MSFDYYVAVHRDKWPTALAVQDALGSLGLPLRLAQPADAPFSVVGSTIRMVFENRSVDLTAEVEQASDADDPASLFGYFADCAAHQFRIANGDYFLTLTFGSDVDQIRAGLTLAAAMILKFDGYGFENQLETHGGVSFAEAMLSEAADAEGFED